jgi:hypothetical protein
MLINTQLLILPTCNFYSGNFMKGENTMKGDIKTIFGQPSAWKLSIFQIRLISLLFRLLY